MLSAVDRSKDEATNTNTALNNWLSPQASIGTHKDVSTCSSCLQSTID